MGKKAHIPAKIKATVRATYAGCVCCGQWDSRDTGHMVAESRGGSLDLSNLRLMCSYCNGALRSANVEFAIYATPNDGIRAIVETNRAAWIVYCNDAIRFWKANDLVAKGKIKKNPYKKPEAYTAPI